MNKKIIVIAYQFSPYRGSEYSVAWNYVNSMSQDNHLTVIYGVNGKYMGDFDDTEEYYKLLKYPQNVTLIPLAPSRFANLLNYPNRHKIWGWAHYLAYHVWHRQLYHLVKGLLTKDHYDLVHFLGPIGYREPGYLWKLDIPYMWGPTSGFYNMPDVCISLLPRKAAFKYRMRNLINCCQRRSARVRKAIRRADVLLAATSLNQQLIEALYRRKVDYLPENGIFAAEINENVLATRDFNCDCLEFFWCGKLNGAKNLQTVLHALALLREKIHFKLHVVGSGPLENQFKALASELKLDDRIEWHGQIERREVLQLWQKAHIQLLSSLFEGNPTVVLEAMCNGVPTICFDTCGMHDTVSDQAGIMVPLTDFERMPQDFAAAIERLASDRELLKKLSYQTLQRAHNYSFDERHKFFNRQYDLAIANYSGRK